MTDDDQDAATPATVEDQAPAPPVKRLKPQWRLFVTAILSGMNQTKAAEAAGFSPKSSRQQGTELMRKPSILAAIDHYEQRAQAASEVDEPWILERLRLEATSMLNSGADRIHALDLQGKYFGMWGGDAVVVNLGASPELEALPIAELRAMVEARRALAGGEAMDSVAKAADGTTDSVGDSGVHTPDAVLLASGELCGDTAIDGMRCGGESGHDPIPGESGHWYSRQPVEPTDGTEVEPGRVNSSESASDTGGESDAPTTAIAEDVGTSEGVAPRGLGPVPE